MALLHYIKEALKPHGDCCVCHKPINIGDSYKYFTPSKRQFAHQSCKIPFTTSNGLEVITYVSVQEYNYRTSQIALWMANRWN